MWVYCDFVRRGLLFFLVSISLRIEKTTPAKYELRIPNIERARQSLCLALVVLKQILAFKNDKISGFQNSFVLNLHYNYLLRFRV